MTENSQTHKVVVTRVFDAPIRQVWRAWSEPDYVKRWWGPNGFTCPLAEMDFREYGSSLVCMRAPEEFGGQDLYNTWTYSKIDPHERIEFIQHFTDKDRMQLDPAQVGIPAGVPKEVRHVITFKELDGDRTELTVTEYGYTSEQVRDLSKTGMEQCLDKMVAIFEKT